MSDWDRSDRRGSLPEEKWTSLGSVANANSPAASGGDAFDDVSETDGDPAELPGIEMGLSDMGLSGMALSGLGASFDLPSGLNDRLQHVADDSESNAQLFIRRRWVQIEPPTRLMVRLRELPREVANRYALLPALWRKPGLAVAASYVAAVGVVLSFGGPTSLGDASSKIRSEVSEHLVEPTREITDGWMSDAETVWEEGSNLEIGWPSVPFAGASEAPWAPLRWFEGSVLDRLGERADRIRSYGDGLGEQLSEIGRRLGLLRPETPNESEPKRSRGLEAVDPRGPSLSPAESALLA